MKRWGKISKLRAIEVAEKTGVPDPEMNPALRTAILKCKS